MEWLIVGGVIVVLVPLGVLAQKKGWIDVTGGSAGTGGSGAGPLGGIDEVFQPTRYEAQLQRDRDAALPIPAPVPGEGGHDIYAGPVRIDLDHLSR